MTDKKTEEQDNIRRPWTLRSLTAQGWWSLAFWLAVGLLLEGLIGFRTPAYLQDSTRRELFRLAHAHGTVLSLLLLIAGLHVLRDLVHPPRAALLALQIGSLLMPIGFMLGGIWHYESDPGPLIVLAPLGGLLIIFGVVAIAMSEKSR